MQVLNVDGTKFGNYGHTGTIHKCPDYQGILIIQFSLHAKAPFVTIPKCVDYAGVLIFKCLV